MTSSDLQIKNKRLAAVSLRQQGASSRATGAAVGLSAPTVISLHKAFLEKGLTALEIRKPGRPKKLSPPKAPKEIIEKIVDLKPSSYLPQNITYTIDLWNNQTLAAVITRIFSKSINSRGAHRLLTQWGWLSQIKSKSNQSLEPCANRLFAGITPLTQDNLKMLWAVTPKGEIFWLAFSKSPTDIDICYFFNEVSKTSKNQIKLHFEFSGLKFAPLFERWLRSNKQKVVLETISAPTQIQSLSPTNSSRQKGSRMQEKNSQLTHLELLEAESIHIMREVVATCENPVMLYSIGKDSAVMLRLALKAFYPAKLPFPLLHVDTTWKFREMYEFREKMKNDHDLNILVHINPEGIRQGINPFTHGSQIHTDIMKTQGLKQALDMHKFDAAFGGARRDEEKSRAKERIFSFRNAQHNWDPKSQRPELWNTYNTKINKGESLRVFPISNWTELDIWQYIHLENIPIVPLYFARDRPVVERDGTLIMVDDDRMPLKKGEVPTIQKVRFRTLGCYPLTGAVDSSADTLTDIIQEMLLTKTSERQGRMIDHDGAASMEKKKQEGYF